MEITTIKPFLEYYENLRKRTLNVIECIPPEKMDWTHKAGKFTFADLIRHLAATERFMFAETVQNKKKYLSRTRKRFSRRLQRCAAVSERNARRVNANFPPIDRRRHAKKVPHSCRYADYSLEMAAGVSGTRNSSSRANLCLLGNAENQRAAALRSDFRGSLGVKQIKSCALNKID